MTPLQSKILFIGALLLLVKLSFGILAYIITKKIERRAKLIKAMEAKGIKLKDSKLDP